MTEHAAEPTHAPSTAPQPTGIADLDAALARVAALDEQPLDEHAAAFEAAHVALRRPLDDPPAELGAPETPA